MVRIPEHGRLLQTGWVLLLGCLIPVSLTAQDDTTAEATSAAADETASATAETTASASDKASDDQPASYEVKQQRLSVEVELNGLFQSEQTAPIRIRPKSWSTLVIREAVPHGTVVKAGDSILWLETKKLDEAITEAEQAIEQSHLSLELAHINREASLQTDELTLESTERTKREADEVLDYFNETDRKRSE